MACKVIGNMIVCGSFRVTGNCSYCDKKHTKLCDFVVGTQGDVFITKKTCDKPMCDDHAYSQKNGVDYCHEHKFTNL